MRTNAILLAGGRSSRMGTDKASLSWKGETWLQSTYMKIKMYLGQDSLILVSGCRPGFICVSDEEPDRGPLEGIWSCTRKMDRDSIVLVVPVDMPLLRGEDLRLLVDRLSMEPEAQFAQFENVEMPFVFNFNVRTDQVLSEIRHQSRPSQRSLKAFKSRLQGVSIPMAHEGLFRNINTPEEWQEVTG